MLSQVSVSSNVRIPVNCILLLFPSLQWMPWSSPVVTAPPMWFQSLGGYRKRPSAAESTWGGSMLISTCNVSCSWNILLIMLLSLSADLRFIVNSTWYPAWISRFSYFLLCLSLCVTGTCSEVLPLGSRFPVNTETVGSWWFLCEARTQDPVAVHTGESFGFTFDAISPVYEILCSQLPGGMLTAEQQRVKREQQIQRLREVNARRREQKVCVFCNHGWKLS